MLSHSQLREIVELVLGGMRTTPSGCVICCYYAAGEAYPLYADFTWELYPGRFERAIFDLEAMGEVETRQELVKLVLEQASSRRLIPQSA